MKLGNITLRKLQKIDATNITKHCSNKEIAKWLSSTPYPYHQKDALWFINDSQKQWSKGTSFRFGIIIDKQLVGLCSLDSIDKNHRNGELGYWLSQECWGKGIMTKVAEAVVNYGFTKLNLHRVDICHAELNKGSKRIIEKLGFQYEGTTRHKFFRFDKWIDTHDYGLLKSEWKRL